MVESTKLLMLGSTGPIDYDSSIEFTLLINLMLLPSAVVTCYDNQSLIITTYESLGMSYL